MTRPGGLLVENGSAGGSHHLICDEKHTPVKVITTAANVNDATRPRQWSTASRPSPESPVVVRWARLDLHGALAPWPRHRGEPPRPDPRDLARPYRPQYRPVVIVSVPATKALAATAYVNRA
ncbi:hypothetical protein AB0N07_20575 [Streptomyces sp. NPDC051172]|uniref:hypothetical protein n=1 Tax=Streptomyces sp. NPDC051172 TaxID=3155796 RepID=UPI00342374E1